MSWPIFLMVEMDYGAPKYCVNRALIKIMAEHQSLLANPKQSDPLQRHKNVKYLYCCINPLAKAANNAQYYIYFIDS